MSDIASLPAAVAAAWVARWDAQQELYVDGRDDRFAVVVAAVEAVGGPEPVVLDLGCGPGSLGARLRRSAPGAWVVGVDFDPVLLALARATQPEAVFVDADLAQEGWVAETGLAPGGVDAVVSTTALHWLPVQALRQVIGTSAALLRPGGIWLDGDHLGHPGKTPELAALARRLREAAEAAERRSLDREDWAQWWEAVRADPAFRALVAERDGRHAARPPARSEPAYDDYVQALAPAGFTEVGELWRRADDVVLAALR
jgi:SAM-dependent methyltransferase